MAGEADIYSACLLDQGLDYEFQDKQLKPELRNEFGEKSNTC
jgi:hypothetical protein